MLSGINVVLFGGIAVVLVLYMLRRRTRIVSTQLNPAGTDPYAPESAETERPTP